MLSRIEELEQMVWRLMGGDMQGLLHQRYGALRRTYGFFESSAHLARRELRSCKGPLLAQEKRTMALANRPF
jgi:hypothetical protein